MKDELTPKALSDLVGISRSYSSQILSGTRPCPQAVALKAFRAFGVRLGLLAEMDDADIAKLAAQTTEPPACHGADACASAPSSFDEAQGQSGAESVHDALRQAQGQSGAESFHDADDRSAPDALSTGQSGQLSRQVAA